ncbi:MAG: AbrB/MazE/SpoVT family DNA-binding domain-containing protein [Woeseia sp.]
MSNKLKLRKIGGSVGVIIPKEELQRLRVDEGDELFAVADAKGLYLSPFNPEFARKVRAFERTRKRYRNALNTLAK